MDRKLLNIAAFADEAGMPLEEQINALKENNISLLEIRGVDNKNIAAITNDEAKEIKMRLDDNGIKVWSIGSPTGKINISDDFSKHLDSFKRMIDSALILGATRYRLFSFYVTKGSKSFFDDVCERLNSFVEASKGSGVILCHENEKDIFGESDDNCLLLAKAIPEIKAIFDPANYIQSGVETLSAWKKIKPFVDYVHIKDALPNGEVVPAGCGIGNIKKILTDYFKSGGKVITLEPHLSVFEGLKELEGSGNRSAVGEGDYKYPTQRAAFDGGAQYLNRLIEEIEL